MTELQTQSDLQPPSRKPPVAVMCSEEDEIEKLGDTIARLSKRQAELLQSYLSSKYGVGIRYCRGYQKGKSNE